jgi:hypothetical protein
VGHLALQLQFAPQVQGPPGLLQMRLGALGPAFGGGVGHLLKLLFALGQLLLGGGADLLAGADLLHHETLGIGNKRET